MPSPATIKVPFRNAHPPFKVEMTDGFYPFEVFGEQFAVTAEPRLYGSGWRATHVDTGVAVPNTACDIKEDVPDKARKLLRDVGEEKLRKALASVRRKITIGK